MATTTPLSRALNRRSPCDRDRRRAADPADTAPVVFSFNVVAARRNVTEANLRKQCVVVGRPQRRPTDGATGMTALGRVSDPRRPRGVRYPLAGLCQTLKALPGRNLSPATAAGTGPSAQLQRSHNSPGEVGNERGVLTHSGRVRTRG